MIPEDWHVIDLTVQLMPILWGLVVLMLVTTGALVASIDPEVVHVYVGNRRALAVAAVVVIVAVSAVAIFEPEIARGLLAR